MTVNRIRTALENATDTHSVVIGAGVLARVEEVFSQCFGDKPALLVADENTYAIAGQAVEEVLRAAGRKLTAPLVFPGSPVLYAEYDNVLAVEAALRATDAIPLAVGSGTLNDLTKLAAGHCGRPYMVAATAAAMDGYTAFGAAITRDGFKQTFACPAPYAVLADLDIIAQAPAAMTASGYADLLGKVTAGADWLIADTLAIEPVDRPVWSLVQDALREWTADPARLQRGDRQAVGFLVEGLMMSGLAMQAHQTSRPASGSEHQFSHLWEMQETTHGAVSHGYKVGLGSISSAALYERVLARDLSNLDIAALCARWPSRDELEKYVRGSHANPVVSQKAVEQSLAKYITAGQLRERLELVRSIWPGLRERLQGQLLTADAIRGLLQVLGCPTHPAGIGKDLAQLKSSYFLARQIRSRYTIFDLAAETGCFGAGVDELFAPGGFWAPQ